MTKLRKWQRRIKRRNNVRLIKQAKQTDKLNRLKELKKPEDVKHSQADVQKIKDVLNFKAKINFEEGLKKTVGWYKQLSKSEYLCKLY